ncbi:MAG: hypothetical protein AB8H79_17925 [Myxococcota bacterium]
MSLVVFSTPGASRAALETMQVFELRQPEQLRLRAHPWIDAEHDNTGRYYNFREHPDQIRTSLEDLKPWAGHASTETFYQLIEWLNGPDSALESNDCAFSGVYPNEGPHSERQFETSGRLMVLFRDLQANTSPERVGGMAQEVAYALSQLGPDLEAIVGVSLVDVQFTELPGPAARQKGQQLMLSFWAWGDSEALTLATLDAALVHLWTAMRSAR